MEGVNHLARHEGLAEPEGRNVALLLPQLNITVDGERLGALFGIFPILAN